MTSEKWWRVTTQIWIEHLIGWSTEQPIRGKALIWVLTRQQNEISLQVPCTSFSQAKINFVYASYVTTVKISSHTFQLHRGYYMVARRYEISLRVLKNIWRVNAANEIPNHLTLTLIVFCWGRRDLLCSHNNGDISRVKTTCYFHMWRYHVFARNLTWHFIGVYIIKNVICSSDFRACIADVIYSRLVTDTTNYRKCVFNFPSSWLAFLTDQSWRVLKSWYTGEGQEQGFRRCFADRLNQKFSSVCGASHDFITSNFRQ